MQNDPRERVVFSHKKAGARSAGREERTESPEVGRYWPQPGCTMWTICVTLKLVLASAPFSLTVPVRVTV